MRPGNSLYQERLRHPSLNETVLPQGAHMRWPTTCLWQPGDKCSTVSANPFYSSLQPRIADIHMKRQQMEHSQPAPTGVSRPSEIMCDNELLFSDDRDNSTQLSSFGNAFSLRSIKAYSGPLSFSFLRSIMGNSYQQRYLQLIRSLSMSSPRYSDIDSLVIMPLTVFDPFKDAQSISTVSQRIPRPIVCRGLLIDAVRLLIHNTPDIVTLYDLEQSARWFVATAPRSIWFSDQNGLEVSIRICQEASKCRYAHSAPIGFLYSYFKASNLPLDTNLERETSLIISTGHLKLGLELYLLIYKYYLIRKTIVFASAHSLNAELQSFTIRTNTRRIYSQLHSVSADIQALRARKTVFQNFRESFPVAATRMNQLVQCLKMALNDASMKILRHQKKHDKNREYWRAKSVELEQTTMQQRKMQQSLQQEIQRLEQQVRSSNLARARASKGAEKIQSSVDKLRSKAAAKEAELGRLNAQLKELNQKLTDKKWQINETQTAHKRELETNLSAMRKEFNRLDVLLSATFSENKPAELHSIMTNMQSYVSRITKIRDLNSALPELGSLGDKVLAIHTHGGAQLISNSITAMQRIEYKVPSKFLSIVTATGISISQRSTLLKELGVFLSQKQSHLMAYCTATTKQYTAAFTEHGNKSSCTLQSNPDVSVVITSASIQPKLCFQRHSYDMTVQDSSGDDKEIEPSASTPKKEEPLSLLGASIPWTLLRYRYSSSWTLEQNILQYLRQTCTLENRIANFHHHRDSSKGPNFAKSISKKSDEYCKKPGIADSNTLME